MPTLRLPLLAAALLAGSALLLSACDSGESDGPTEPSFERSEMLAQWADALILPAYRALETETDALAAASAAFAAAPSVATLQEARAALRRARFAWQDASPYGFGPAEMVALRASLNTYPASTDQIEANVAQGGYTLGALSNTAAVGFPAIAYLLHGGSEAETVAAFGDPLRRQYLTDNVAFVRSAVASTVEAWEGDYRASFLSADNAGTDVGSALGMVVNAAVLHYERFLRDGKVGIPAGVRSAGVARPTSVEAYHGGYSAELAAANLRAIERLFLGDGPGGAPGIGLDDNLRALGAGALADEIEAEMQGAIAAVAALRDPLDEQIERDNEALLEAFRQMQDVVVLLKADMTSVLGVTITFQDNDGD
jgi:predicted lipoprotein